MYDEYFEEAFPIGPVELKIGESHSFTFNKLDWRPEEKFTIELMSIDGESASIRLNGEDRTLKRKFQYFIDRLAIRSVLFTGNTIAIVYGDQFHDL